LCGITRKGGEPGFTHQEATILRRHARDFKPSTAISKKTAAAKRWVPWLCAYSGARVGEIVQLRRQDVRVEGIIAFIVISPEAGTVKGKKAREVPLHPDLVEQGFLQFVERSNDGYLFVRARPLQTASQCAKVAIFVASHATGRASTRTVTIIGLDPAKPPFRPEAHGALADGNIAFRKKLVREKVLGFLVEQPRCVVAMEASGSGHHWGRAIRDAGTR
jgi:hypothetical protein